MSSLTSMELPAAVSQRIHVAGQLRDMIRTGALRGQSALPSERALANHFRVHRTTLRRALEDLSHEGLVLQRGRRRIVSVKAEQEHTWMQRAIAVLMPPWSSSASGVVRWVEYATMGVVSAVQKAECHAIALNLRELSEGQVQKLAEARPMGVLVPEVFAGGKDTLKAVECLRATGVPVVVYGDHPELAGYDRVVSDHEQGGYELTRWLLSQQRRSIVQLWSSPLELYWMKARRCGYERAMREAGLEPLPAVQVPPVDSALADRGQFDDYVKRLAGYLLASPVDCKTIDAVMVVTDRDSFAVASALRLFGHDPERHQPAIVGYDNIHLDCEERRFEPSVPVATVDKNNTLMGQAMVELLMDRLAGRLPEQAERRVVQPRLIPISALT